MSGKLIIVSAVLQIVCALILLGLAVYYFIVQKPTHGLLLGAVGVVFIIKPVYSLIKYVKDKNSPPDQQNKKDFIK